MTEIINIQCPVCGEYIPKNSQICEYCGEVINEEKRNISDLNNIDHKQDIKNSGQVFEKNGKKENIKAKILQIALILVIISLFLGVFLYFDHMHSKINVSIGTEEEQPYSAASDYYDSSDTIQQNNNSNDNLKQAIALYKLKEYEAAAEIFQLEAEKNNNSKAYYYLGEIYNDQLYTNIAISYYKKAILYNSKFFDPKKRLTKIYLNRYDYASALEYGSQAMELNPNDKDFLYFMVSIYRHHNYTDELIETYKKIVSIDKSDYNANIYLSDYYYNKNEYKEAAPYFRNLLETEYSYTTAYKLAYCYMQIEYYSEAIKIYDIIMDKSPYEYYYAFSLKNRAKRLRELYLSNHKK